MYLGIDLGTSGVKGVLIDDDQRVRAEQNSSPLAVDRPQRNWSEQDPDLWWRAVEEVLDALAAQNPAELSRTRGIGLSARCMAPPCSRADDRPLRPAILWNDTRSRAECRILEEREPSFRQLTGRQATAAGTATKLEWLRRHERGVFDRVRTVLLPKDYVRLQLSGDKASDVSDSSGTFWLDVAKREWSEKLLAAGGMERSQMPELFEGNAPDRPPAASFAPTLGHGRKSGDRRWRRRQRLRGLWRRHRQAGRRNDFAGHLGGVVRGDERSPPQPCAGDRNPVPRRSQCLASDGGHHVRERLFELAFLACSSDLRANLSECSVTRLARPHPCCSFRFSTARGRRTTIRTSKAPSWVLPTTPTTRR